MNIEAIPSVATSSRSRRTVLSVAIAVLATIPIATGASGASDEPAAADTTESAGEAGPHGLVTEEVERGVERIIRDDAGHDLDETHPTYRYDMDDITITPDGTVWLSTTYSRSDNDANPPGALLWALGQPGTSRLPDDCYAAERGMGVICVDESGVATTYLTGTPINEVAVAPDGTVWAVGGYDGDNGGLYRITRD